MVAYRVVPYMRLVAPPSKGQVLDKPPQARHGRAMTTLLTFGDSNTHGTPPIEIRGLYRRYGPDVRWPRLAAAARGWDLVEEGLPGRTAQFDDPVMDGIMNGWPALRQALQSHGPIDWLTVMLGTNDTKTRFGAEAPQIAAGIAGLLDLALGDEMQARHGGFRVLLIAPVPVEERGVLAGEFYGAAAKSRALAPLLADLARHRGVGFLDAGLHARVSPVDGVHLTPEAHASLGQAVARALG